MTRTRLFFATDIHGSETCFLKFLNAQRLYKANVMVLGGDLSGKTLVPIVEREDGAFEVNFLGVHRVLQEAEIGALEGQIKSIGSYPYRADRETFDKLSVDSRALEDLFSRLIAERLKRWIELAEEKLDGSGAEVYISGGNDDQPFVEDLLRRSNAFIDPEMEIVKVRDNYEMITCAWTNPTPWHTSREASEEELTGKLDRMASGVMAVESCIFNIHVPPIDSGLDLSQKLDESLRPIFSGGQPVMFGAGSRAVRAAIERYQPLLGLHGHIHESRGASRIGRTLCLNPGSEYAETILRGVIIDLDTNQVKSYLFSSG